MGTLFLLHATVFLNTFLLRPFTATFPMRYAIVSDLHANIRAWNSVLADLREQGADLVVCLGDVVGYGPNPAEVLKSVRTVTTNFVLGNHDAAAVGMIDYSIFNDHARQAIEWTMTKLDPEAKKFLSSVPLAIDTGEVFFVHAEISEPGRFDYISDTVIAKENFKARDNFVTFIGHTHFPKIFEQNTNGDVTELPDNNTRLRQGRRYIVNVGSVGEPRDADDLSARYVIYDSETRNVIFRRVEFDIPAYRKDIEATSLTFRPFFLRVYEHISEGREVEVISEGNALDMKVSHNSASLVDLGKVSSVANITNSGMLLKSAQPSRSPIIILAVLGFITLVTIGVLLLNSRQQPATTPTIATEKTKTTPVPNREPETVNQTTTNEEIPPMEKEVEIPEPEPKLEPKVTPEEITKIPDKPTPKPKIKSIPKPPEPKPKPVPDVSNATVEVAWWRMGDGKDGESLVDEKGQVTLMPLIEGKTMKALAPNPVPANQAENTAAKQLGVWQEEKSSNHFNLTADHSFTFEGWFLIDNFRKPVFLFGTRSSKEDRHGWHLDLRSASQAHLGESICFFYDSGSSASQAIAKNLKISDGKAHHFAVVWDHDKLPDQGDMKLYLDGNEIASVQLPHSQINDKTSHPFRVGAEINRAKLGLDELRFTRKTLQPHEFLIRAAITGSTLLKADARHQDSWSIPASWDDGKVPSGEQSVIIGPGLDVQINKSNPPSFSGSLVLKENALLQIWSQQGESVIPKSEGKLVMYNNSQLRLRSQNESKLGPIELIESANIFGGISTSGHNTTRVFASEISGPGKLIITGVNGNTFVFQTQNFFSGGLAVKSISNQTFKVVAAVNGCFGKSVVNFREHASLHIREKLKNTIADHATLILKGPKGTLPTKLVLDSDETVGRFVVDEVDQGKGVFTKTTHPAIISGEGKLTVE